MKKSYLFVGNFLLVSASYAAVKLDMNMNLNGKVSKPTIITQFGQTAVLTETSFDPKEGFEISATPFPMEASDDGAKQAVKLAFVVSKVVGSDKIILARPQVTTWIGQKATITQESADGERLELTVTPTLQ